MLNSMVSVSDDYSCCSLIAYTNTDARSTPHYWKSVFIGHCCGYNFEHKLFHCRYIVFGQMHRSFAGMLQGNMNVF